MDFARIHEKDITEAIFEEFHALLSQITSSDAVVVGGGPSGLMAAKTLAEEGFHTVLIEHNNYLGGGFWLGGYLMSPVTVREPAQQYLEAIGVPLKKVKEGLYITQGPHAVSKLIAATCDAGVKILNMTRVEDAIVREGRVEGAVINWTPVAALPRAVTCVDPVGIESKLVIDASGHDAVVCEALKARGLLEFETCGAMWVDRSEAQLVERTQEIFPGLIVAGMAVSTYFGTPRMGPTFAGMLASGCRAAEVAKQHLKKRSAAVA